MSFDFRESDPYIPEIAKDVMTQIELAIIDKKNKRATVVIGNDRYPRNPNVKEAID